MRESISQEMPGMTTPRERMLAWLREVAFKNNMTAAQILGPSRERPVVIVRHAIMHALYLEGWSKSEIGRFFNRDHTTVGYAIKGFGKSDSIHRKSFPNDSLSVPVVPYNGGCNENENRALNMLTGEVPPNARPQDLCVGKRVNNTYLNPPVCQGVHG